MVTSLYCYVITAALYTLLRFIHTLRFRFLVHFEFLNIRILDRPMREQSLKYYSIAPRSQETSRNETCFQTCPPEAT